MIREIMFEVFIISHISLKKIFQDAKIFCLPDKIHDIDTCVLCEYVLGLVPHWLWGRVEPT
jgi:hypothetical protein